MGQKITPDRSVSPRTEDYLVHSQISYMTPPLIETNLSSESARFCLDILILILCLVLVYARNKPLHHLRPHPLSAAVPSTDSVAAAAFASVAIALAA